jgi:mono/diheme cytochrome c family protein
MLRFRSMLPAFELIAGCCVAFIAGSIPLEAAGRQQDPSNSSPMAVATHQAVLKQYCVTCHNQRLKTAQLTLDTIDIENPAANAAVWEKVIRKLRTRAMPPPGTPRPDQATYTSLASWLEHEIDRVADAKPNPGRTETFHRLNRAEYQNAIRDLLAIEIDVTSLLPPDDSSYGFDNIAGVLKVSPTLLDRYIAAARTIASVAVGSRDMVPDADTFRVRSDLSQRGRVDGLPLGTRGGTAFRHTFPLDAEYEFKIEVAQAAPPDPHQFELSIDGAPVRLMTLVRMPAASADLFGAAAQRKNPGLTFRVPVKAGPRDIAATFFMKPSALLDGLREPFSRDGAGLPTLGSITITGPFAPNGATDTPSRRRIFGCYPASAGEERPCATKILASLVRRAYRRPATEADLEVLRPFYERGRANADFDAGVEMAVRRVLVSPEFLFRIERDPANGPHVYRVSDLELASRLSFFLWSSIPDDELLDVAVRGTLRKPAVLERQIRRMLADPRSQALAQNFAGQWLDLRTLPTVAPDLQLFPNFSGDLRQDFEKETELFFESLLRENRSVLELLSANYTFVNERLAKHYGIPHVYGSRFRRVSITDENRYGLLGQGSFLTVTSHSDRTSVVGRGKWILEHLLGAPPPPPPPNVSANLPESTAGGKPTTMRERLIQHRANPVCASCHARMDPLGFALENFDATGQWRTQEGYQPIDTSAVLADGTTFDSPAGLRNWLMRYPEQIVTAATERLLTYALGRGVEYYDAPAVRTITRRAARSNYSLSSLIVGVVESVPFQMKRAPEDATRSAAATVPVR